MFVVKDPLSTNFQTNVFKAGRTNSSWINVLPKCVLLLDKCVLFGLMHLVTQLRLVLVEGYSYQNWRRESCVIYSILFCSLLLCSILLCLSVSLLFMFKEEEHEEDEKKDESYFLFFSPKRWFVILAFHVPHKRLLLFPSRFLIRTCFYPLRCWVSPFLPFKVCRRYECNGRSLIASMHNYLQCPCVSKENHIAKGSHYIEPHTPS